MYLLPKFAEKVNLEEPVDPEKIEIEKDDSFPMAYAFYLKLDSKPANIWKKIFKNEWKGSMFLLKREVKIADDRLRVVTAPDEIEGKVDWVRGLVDATNESIDKYNEELKKKEEMEKRKRNHQEETIAEMRKRLKKSLK